MGLSKRWVEIHSVQLIRKKSLHRSSATFGQGACLEQVDPQRVLTGLYCEAGLYLKVLFGLYVMFLIPFTLSLSLSLSGTQRVFFFLSPAFTEAITRFREMVDLNSRQRFSSWNHFKRFFKKQKQTNDNRNKSTSKILEKVRRGER